ncbi:MAG TPA: hypothetical protein VI300_25725, partial [Solirubrobacter sp.]
TGTTGCTGPGGDVIVAVAPPGLRRFTGRTVVSRAPGKAVRMAVMGPDAVALAWLNGTCDTTEADAGLPYVAAVRGGSASAPVALGNASALTVLATPAPSGADVSFATSPSGGPAVLMHAQIAPDGAVAAPVAAPDGWIALAGDPAGDQLIGQPDPSGGGARTPLAARSAVGGMVDAAPLPEVGYPWTSGTFAARGGRALAALSFRPLSSMNPSIVVSVWRP